MSVTVRPIFVVGAPRSGTTLFRVILSSHSKIYIPPESDFIPRLFLGRPREAMTPDEARRNLGIVLGYRRFFREWRVQPLDPAAFVASLPELSPAAFLNELYERYAGQYGADRWGDKSPIHTNYVDLLSEIFPASQFVHVIRDGRDAALSSLRAYPDRVYVDIYFAARTWRERVRAARRAGLALGPQRYMEVRYEALTSDPEPVLRGVCDFLDERYEAAMRQPQELARELLRPQGRHAPVREPIHPNFGRWRREMPLEDQRLFQSVAGDTLRHLGYEMPDVGRTRPIELTRRVGLVTKYHVLGGGRRVLQTVGVFHPH